MIFAVAGVVAMIVASNFDYRYWQKLATPVMGVAILLLIVVLFMPKDCRCAPMDSHWKFNHIPAIGNRQIRSRYPIRQNDYHIRRKMKTFRYGILPF